MNHVFLMQVHKEPELFGRIVHRLKKANHFFIINVDLKVSDVVEFKNAVQDVSNIYFSQRENVMHGGYSQVLCTLHQLRYLEEMNIPYDYIHTISGQDYPIVDSEKFDLYFQQNNYSYMYFDDINEVLEWRKSKYKERLEHWYFDDYINKQWMIKMHIPGIVRRISHFFPRKFKWDMEKIWGGGIGFL